MFVIWCQNGTKMIEQFLFVIEYVTIEYVAIVPTLGTISRPPEHAVSPEPQQFAKATFQQSALDASATAGSSVHDDGPTHGGP